MPENDSFLLPGYKNLFIVQDGNSSIFINDTSISIQILQ